MKTTAEKTTSRKKRKCDDNEMKVKTKQASKTCCFKAKRKRDENAGSSKTLRDAKQGGKERLKNVN